MEEKNWNYSFTPFFSCHVHVFSIMGVCGFQDYLELFSQLLSFLVFHYNLLINFCFLFSILPSGLFVVVLCVSLKAFSSVSQSLFSVSWLQCLLTSCFNVLACFFCVLCQVLLPLCCFSSFPFALLSFPPISYCYIILFLQPSAFNL